MSPTRARDAAAAAADADDADALAACRVFLKLRALARRGGDLRGLG